MLRRRLAGVDDRLPRSPLADLHLPEVARGPGGERDDDAVEDGAERAYVALGAMGLAAVDVQGNAEGVERVGGEGEGAARQDQRVEPVLAREGHAEARELRGEEADVPLGGVRDEDGALEDAQHFFGDLGERGAPARVTLSSPWTCAAPPTRPSTSAAGETRLATRPHDLAADHALDADLDDAVFGDIEAGHLQVDEGERRLGEREVPGRTGGRDGAGQGGGYGIDRGGERLEW